MKKIFLPFIVMSFVSRIMSNDSEAQKNLNKDTVVVRKETEQTDRSKVEQTTEKLKQEGKSLIARLKEMFMRAGDSVKQLFAKKQPSVKTDTKPVARATTEKPTPAKEETTTVAAKADKVEPKGEGVVAKETTVVRKEIAPLGSTKNENVLPLTSASNVQESDNQIPPAPEPVLPEQPAED